MYVWKPDPRFPLFFSHFLIFYLLLALPTVGFALAGLVLQLKRFAELYDSDSCYTKEIVTVAVAFPTSIFALIHAIGLALLSKRHSLTVKGLLISSIAMGILWIPTLVIGWQPYNSFYSISDESTHARSRCFTVTGLFLQADSSYYYYIYTLSSRLQVLMGLIIMTFSTL
jgi:ABC-type spermidine/putrescine transport system permease subunit II